MINTMDLANVVLNEKMTGTKADWKISKQGGLDTVVFQLARDKPLWTFVCTSGYNNEVREVHVYQDGEKLGWLENTYFRGSYVVEVTNHRIAANRQRGGGLRTKDVDKAISTAKKMFARKSPTEVINDALQSAAKTIGEEVRTREHEKRRHTHTVEQAMLAYVKDTIEGRAMFMRFVREHDNTKVTEAIEKAERMNDELNVLNKLQSIGGENNTLVMRRDEGYLVKHAGDVKYVKDEDLSMEFRAKLGMLKLVEVKHFIDDSGGRIDEDTFVVFGSPNNVSQEGESNEQA